MIDFVIYDLKVAALIAVFYFCYRLLMERDTLHRLHRVVLLAAAALSLVLPLCVVTLHETVWVEGLQTADRPGPYIAEHATAMPLEPGDSWWQLVLAGGVAAGIVARLAFLLSSYLRLRQMLRGGDVRQSGDGVRLVVVDEPVAPFSWMNTIVVNRQDYAEHNPLLLIHERSHVRLHHSRDIVFVELLTAFQWFNPVVWLLSRDLRTIHEYEADEAVLSQGADTARYISLLMQKATGVQACALVNGINTSETTKRIRMMIKKKSPRWSWLKCLYIVPVAALSLAVTAKTVTDYRVLPSEENTPGLQADADDPVFETCDVMPRFPGGDAELMKFLMTKVKYPASAMENGVQGTVLVQFIVEKDGSLSSFEADKVRAPGGGSELVVIAMRPDMTDEQKQKAEGQNMGLQALKDESVRVVKLMPKWQPGKQDGKAVRVRCTLPVMYRLQ